MKVVNIVGARPNIIKMTPRILTVLLERADSKLLTGNMKKSRPEPSSNCDDR